MSTPKSDLSSQFNVVAQLILVDPVGFQIPYSKTSIVSPSSSISPPTAKLSSESNEMHKTGNFTDLIFNYAYECFNQLYFDSNILLDEQRLKHSEINQSITKKSVFLGLMISENLKRIVNYQKSNFDVLYFSTKVCVE
ncbi:unnamed protein product [Schistosoma mattheei]|uniref:Uncharacterized protein n=1 Tax=Schistosoma mattheei TaxID=31246 RepID=A0A3P8CBT7_9TREM|nr:unnamed protein product [Schistosoma mattheei]